MASKGSSVGALLAIAVKNHRNGHSISPSSVAPLLEHLASTGLDAKDIADKFEEAFDTYPIADSVDEE